MLSWGQGWHGTEVETHKNVGVLLSVSLPQTGPLTESGWGWQPVGPAVLLSPPVGHKELQVLVFTAVHVGGDIWSQSSSWCCKDCHPGCFSLDVKLLFHSWRMPVLGTDGTAPLLCWFWLFGRIFHLHVSSASFIDSTKSIRPLVSLVLFVSCWKIEQWLRLCRFTLQKGTKSPFSRSLSATLWCFFF